MAKKAKSVQSSRSSEQARKDMQDLTTRLTQVEWKVVAGPPGTPQKMLTWEDPDRKEILWTRP